jgi:hypothetical protein
MCIIHFGDESFEKLSSENECSSLSLLRRISIRGNADSKWGKIYFKSSNKFQNNQLKHDFAIIKIIEGVQPAKKLAFLLHSNYNIDIVQYYSMIRYLQPSHNSLQPNAIYKCLSKIYEWEYNVQNSKQTLTAIIEISIRNSCFSIEQFGMI